MKDTLLSCDHVIKDALFKKKIKEQTGITVNPIIDWSSCLNASGRTSKKMTDINTNCDFILKIEFFLGKKAKKLLFG